MLSHQSDPKPTLKPIKNPLEPGDKSGLAYALTTLMTLGLLSFATLAALDLRTHFYLAHYTAGLAHRLAHPKIAGLERSRLARDLRSALVIYHIGYRLFLPSLVFGLAGGLAMIIIVVKYLKERNRTEASLLQAFFALAESIESHDGGTSKHCAAVRSLSLLVGRRFDFSPRQLRQLAMGAQLHDLGKIAIPDCILQKSGSLEPDEWATMRSHPLVGANIIGPNSFLPRSRRHRPSSSRTFRWHRLSLRAARDGYSLGR